MSKAEQRLLVNALKALEVGDRMTFPWPHMEQIKRKLKSLSARGTMYGELNELWDHSPVVVEVRRIH